jgi:hypothetical protein
MKSIFIVLSMFIVALVYTSCKKKDTEFRDLLGGKELVYPGLPANTNFRSGNKRILLQWNPSPDPTITKYVVYWNNNADSMVVNATSHRPSDTVKVLIPNLQEYVYSFNIYSFDNAGNKSIPLPLNNARVYGPLYTAGLLNRGYNATTPYAVNSNGSVTLNFITPDTINISTTIRYTNNSNAVVEKLVSADSSSVTLPDYKAGTNVLYRSAYVPVRNAIDTFVTNAFDTFPKIFTYVQANKSLFQERKLLNDVDTYEPGTSVSKLWDGTVTPQGYPNIFHSDGSYLPHVLTFDMGATYTNLGRIEETGRDCCNNPTKFEVWGTNDIANGVTTLRADNSGWKAEAIAKGWVLLKEVTRSDDGKAAWREELIANPPPVRYIRIRVITTATGSTYSNMSELTFWSKQ